MSARYTGGLVYNAPGGWSGYFDGSGDNLTVSSSAGVTGTGAFTVEFWVYMTATQSFSRPISGGADQFTIDLSSDGVINYGKAGVNNIISSNVGALLNTWRHIVIARSSGGTARMWANGISVGTATDSNNYTAGTVYIGSTSVPSFYLTGYLSNVRITNTDVYGTSNTTITVPTGALLPVSGTSLLTCAYPTFRDGSSNNFTITVTGNTAVSNVNPFSTSQLPNPALGGAGNGVYTMSQYAALKAANLWPAFDPYYKNVTLNLHGNGTNAAQNNTFLDSSTNNFTITRNGNTTQGTFSPYGSNWSNYFDGSGDYLSVADANALDFAGDFTVEAWVFVPTTSGNARTIIHKADTNVGYALVMIPAGNIEVQCTSLQFNSTSTLPLNQWNHVAMVRSGSGTNNVKFYLNGVLDGQGTNTTDTASAITLGVGAVARSGAAGVNPLNGYISNIRLVASAVYTSAFTPSTTPLTAITNTSLLTCQSNRFIDNSTNNFTITKNGDVSVQRFSPFSPTTAYSTSVIGGSGYFDGSGDYLTLPVNSAFDLGTNACCIESWVYLTSTSAIYMFATSSNVNGQTRPNFYARYDQLQLDYFGNVIIQANVSVPQNAWNHVVFTRASSSGAWRIFLNGVLQAYNATGSQNLLQTGAAQLVNSLNGSTTASGYICDLRVVNGAVPSAYVTSSTTTGTVVFTPPTAPLTAVSSTQLLLNFTNAGILDNAMMNDLETVGNAQISTSVVKYGTGSMYFDGSTGNLVAPYSPNYSLGTGDFTVEGWFYFTNLNTNQRGLVALGDGANGSGPIYNAWSIVYRGTEGSNQLVFYRYDGTEYSATTTGVSLSANTWTHIAVCRAAGALRIFVNGVSYYSASNTLNYSAVNTNPLRVALQYYGPQSGYGGPRYWPGYIDDLRITKGVARYIGNFTPPTSQVQDQ